MNQSQPHEFTVTVINHGEPTGNKPQSAKIYFDAEPNAKQSFDLSHLSDTQNFKLIQTAFIDNYDNDGDLIIEIPETSQRIICKAGKQGYFPILAYNRLKLIVYHKGTVKKQIPIYLLNFIISQGSW